MVRVTLFLLLLASPALAQETVSDWFRSLKTPMPVAGLPEGVSCCHEADCKQRTIRANGFVREAWIEEINDWAVIPVEARITDPEVLSKHPFFQSVICFIPGKGVVCEATPPAGG
jgi:hypothetical protein